MLKYSLPAVALLAVGLSACLDDPTSNVTCEPYNNPVTGTAGDTVITQVGLRYIETAPGASQQEARWCALAVVQYSGMLVDGTVFDPGAEPIDFTPGAANIIPGFQFGVVGMNVGEERRLIIPPALGYQNVPQINQVTGDTIIPANSTLIFDVELISTQ